MSHFGAGNSITQLPFLLKEATQTTQHQNEHVLNGMSFPPISNADQNISPGVLLFSSFDSASSEYLNDAKTRKSKNCDPDCSNVTYPTVCVGLNTVDKNRGESIASEKFWT